MGLRLVVVLALVGSGCGRFGFGDVSDGRDADGDGPITPTTVRSQLHLAIDPTETLADFPLLVVLDDQRAARDLMQADASDLRFFDTGGNVLAHEIEQLGAAGGAPLIAWVRVPSIVGTSTTISIDYANGTPPAASSASVWTGTYAGVWHLADLRDATTFHHDGSWLGGAMNARTGIAGPTLAFVGAANNAISIADDANLTFTQAFSVSGWINPTTLAAASGYAAIISRQNGTGVNDDFWLGVDNPTKFADAVISVPSGTQVGLANGAIPLVQWSQLAMTYDGTTERLYVNGTQVQPTAVTGDMRRALKPIYLAADHNSASALPDADFINGAIDEVRLEAVTRTPAWLAYDYASVRDLLITYGAVTR